MEYTIEQERLMQVMLKFLNNKLPDLELPLKKVSFRGTGNSGWGSSMHDYHFWTYYYMDENKDNWFVNFDCRQSEEHWDVNERLEPLFLYFGEENFELFVKWLFRIDLTEDCQCKYLWFFTDMGKGEEEDEIELW